MLELPDPILAGIFIAAGTIKITERDGKYIPIVYVVVHAESRSCLHQLKKRFGGDVRSAPFGRSSLAQWELRSGKGIGYLCTVLDPFKELMSPTLAKELDLIQDFVREDGRGKRGRNQNQVQANKKAIYDDLKQLQTGRAWTMEELDGI